MGALTTSPRSILIHNIYSYTFDACFLQLKLNEDIGASLILKGDSHKV